ncbi:MAG: tetratricopeptide repeat protein, partial [Ignavibacteriae bacterium]|nr:tetratricopeptide repeat protein [Ignavibacteriota bacterium]
EEELKHFETLVLNLQKKKFESVIKEGKQLINEFPDTAFLYLCIAIAYLESERIDEGLAFLQKAEKRFPDNFEILFQLGKAYEYDSEITKAIKYYFKSFEATPLENKKARANCYNEIGALLAESGKEEEAEKIWKEGLVIDPANKMIKNNLKLTDINEDDENDENFADEVFSDFSYYQECLFFDAKGRTGFKSKKEEENFRGHIDEAFIKEIVPRFQELENMTEDERVDFYEDVEIDLSKPIDENELPEFGDEIKSHMRNVFPYLPDDGLLIISLVIPALEYSGISEEKLNNFIAQTEYPDGKETHILKWAYELGTNVIEFTKIENEEQKELSFIKIMGLLSQELSESDSLIVLDYIFDRLGSDEEDEDDFL